MTNGKAGNYISVESPVTTDRENADDFISVDGHVTLDREYEFQIGKRYLLSDGRVGTCYSVRDYDSERESGKTDLYPVLLMVDGSPIWFPLDGWGSKLQVIAMLTDTDDEMVRPSAGDVRVESDGTVSLCILTQTDSLFPPDVADKFRARAGFNDSRELLLSVTVDRSGLPNLAITEIITFDKGSPDDE